MATSDNDQFGAPEGGCPAATPQPAPERGGRSITILVVDDILAGVEVSDVELKVCRDLVARDAMGFAKYHQNLETFDGRDTIMDAYQECLDLCQYLKKAAMEGDNVKALYLAAVMMAMRLARIVMESNEGGAE